MRIGSLALVLLPWMVAPAAIAQPMDDQGAADEDQYDDAAPGEPVDNVDVFYDRLADNGTWVDEPNIGHVFIPDQNNFVPYQNGYWKRTSVGFVWVSDEPFSWATTHYGRWAYSNPYNRWVWLPDTTWGPSWVDWRESGDHLGWAPLAPEIVIRTGYVTPVEYWHYAPGARILDVNLVRYYEPRERIITYHRVGTPMEHYARIGGARVIVGPPTARLRAYGVSPAAYRPVKIEARLSGRMTPVEYHAAVQRAHDRHDMIETRNRQRIEANPHIREVHAQATVKWNNSGQVRPGTPGYHAPAHVEPVRPAGGHVEPVRPGSPGYGTPGHVEPAHPGQPGYGTPGHTEPAHPGQPGYGTPGHTEPAHPGSPGYGTPGHTEPAHPGSPGYGTPGHTEPAHPGQPGYGTPSHPGPGPGHVEPPPTHTAPPSPTYGGPTHQAPAPMPPTHTAPPSPTYGGPTHQAPPPTHTGGGSTYTGGGAHQAPAPSRPAPARTPPSKDPKKH